MGAQPGDRVEHGVVLDGAGQDADPAGIGRPTGPEQTLDREVVRLGPTCGEHDLGGPGTEGRREGLAGLLHDPAGAPTGGVQGRRVARERELGSHRRQRLGEHRRRRRVIEVGHRVKV